MKTQLLAIALAASAATATNAQARPLNAPPPPDPETVVVDMFATYDIDESNSLDNEELVAAFIATRAKHMSQRYEAGLCPQNRQGDRGPGMGRGNGQGMGQRQGRGPRAPQEFVPSLIKQFDSDGDSALNTEEAIAAITFMHEVGGGPRAFPPPPPPGLDEES